VAGLAGWIVSRLPSSEASFLFSSPTRMCISSVSWVYPSSTNFPRLVATYSPAFKAVSTSIHTVDRTQVSESNIPSFFPFTSSSHTSQGTCAGLSLPTGRCLLEPVGSLAFLFSLDLICFLETSLIDSIACGLWQSQL
jgi:hypothetical protein